MIFIIHGTEGDGNENFFPWLRDNLQGREIITPKFPTPDNQTLESWRTVFEPYMDKLEDAILVGHCSGCAFILDIIQRSDRKIKAVFLVAAFASVIESEFDHLLESFVKREFDWDLIRKNTDRIYLYSSENDPYVPQKFGMEIARRTGGQLTLMNGMGHFNIKKFPLLLEDIKKSQ